jgi:hypothetical protein
MNNIGPKLFSLTDLPTDMLRIMRNGPGNSKLTRPNFQNTTIHIDFPKNR